MNHRLFVLRGVRPGEVALDIIARIDNNSTLRCAVPIEWVSTQEMEDICHPELIQEMVLEVQVGEEMACVLQYKTAEDILGELACLWRRLPPELTHKRRDRDTETKDQARRIALQVAVAALVVELIKIAVGVTLGLV